jgi:hypothetical protein
MCRDPLPDAEAALVVELDDEADVDVRSVVADLGGDVERLRFSWRVRLPETAVADLCSVDGLARVETADTLSLGLDDHDE